MKYILRISNTHLEISKFEVVTLFQGDKIEWINELMIELTSDRQDVVSLASQSASIKWIMRYGLKLGKIENLTKLEQQIEQLWNSEQTPKADTQTFAARMDHLFEKHPVLKRDEVQRYLGGCVLDRFPNLKVNLTNPDQIYLIVSQATEMFCGWLIYEGDYQDIANRSPKESPFFSGGAMKAMMSKLLVNLQYPLDAVLLDPFSGHGGFLREISNNGCLAIGFEITWKIIRESLVNNKYHNETNVQIVAADALKSPLRKQAIRQVVTDPPYAMQSTTIGRDRESLVELWLEQSTQQSIIMTLPEDMQIRLPIHFKLEYQCSDYVHRSLTRVVRKLVRL